MPGFTGNKYPEELRALRAQYPNTQFDSHGRVIGSMPLNQYNTQPANPAAIPASVRTYSQFDPATGTWIRHTNGAASPVQGMTPTSTPGIYFRPKQQTQPARQVMRPLARNVGGPRTARNTEITVSPVVVNGEEALAVNNIGRTPSGIEFVGGQPVSLDRTQNIPTEYDGEIRSLNNVPASLGVVGQPVVNIDPADIGQSVPIREATPNFNFRPEDRYTPERAGELLDKSVGKAIAVPGEIALTLLAPWTRGVSAATGLGLGVAPRLALSAPRAAAAARTGSRLGGVRDAVTGLYNKAGGFLRREHVPTANFTVDAAGNAQATSPYTTNVIGDALRNGYQTVRGWFTR